MIPKLVRVRQYTCNICKRDCSVRHTIDHTNPSACCPVGKWGAWAARDEPPLPSIGIQIKSAARAIYAAGKAILEHKPLVATKEEQERRQAICQGCEFLRKDGRCAKCGCGYKAKIRLATEHCPIGKW